MIPWQLERRELLPDRTLGWLKVEGVQFCWTLEDPVRPPGEPKVPGETAIPEGVYGLACTVSQRATDGSLWSPDPAHRLPLVVDVPGFTGIRLHAGNTPGDTAGCVLVGGRGPNNDLVNSRKVLESVVGLLLLQLARSIDGVQLTVSTRPLPPPVDWA
jgi:hypothetical protein